MLPRGTKVNEQYRAAHTRLQSQINENTERSLLWTQIDVPREVHPAFLAFAVFVEGTDGAFFYPLQHGQFVSVPLGASVGNPIALGASLTGTAQQSHGQEGHSVNFAVVSRHAGARNAVFSVRHVYLTSTWLMSLR